eukprot:scaffold1126_cov242-Pinguiococcus_pyrenoidosus.AAC.2
MAIIRLKRTIDKSARSTAMAKKLVAECAVPAGVSGKIALVAALSTKTPMPALPFPTSTWAVRSPSSCISPAKPYMLDWKTALLAAAHTSAATRRAKRPWRWPELQSESSLGTMRHSFMMGTSNKAAAKRVPDTFAIGVSRQGPKVPRAPIWRT